MSLSDGEGDRGEVEVLDSSRKGVFTFDPMGPDNLNDLEHGSEYVLTTQQITEEEECNEESKEEIRNLPVPESTLKMLADENISMKEDLELKLG